MISPKPRPRLGYVEVPDDRPEDRWPHNVPSEEYILAAILVDETSDSLNKTLPFLSPDDFFVTGHAKIYRAIQTLASQGNSTVDSGSVFGVLFANREFSEEDGLEVLGKIVRDRVHSVALDEHVDVVARHATARNAILAAQRLAEDLRSSSPVWETLRQHAEDVANLSARTTYGSNVTTCLADVEPKELVWLYRDRIPLGKLTTYAGHGGLGKSFVTLDHTFRITTGTSWPETPDEPNPVGSVILVSTEDDIEDTTVPRLMAMGADLSRVRTLNTEQLGKFTLADLEPLERAIKETPGVRLIVIDPVTAHIGITDDHKNAPLRALLAPLAAFATKHQVAIILVTHTNKAASGNAAGKVIGSVAWVNAVRAAWLFMKDKETKGRRLLVPIKSNLSPDPTGLAYSIDRDTGKVVWETNTIAVDADDLNTEENGGSSRSTVAEKAAEWLREFLEEFAHPSEEIFETGKRAGHSKKALYAAKEALGIKAKNFRLGGNWFWGLGSSDSWRFGDSGEDNASNHELPPGI